MTHPQSEAGTSVEVKSFDERLKEIVQKVVDDAELRVVTMKPTYDSVDLGLALLRPLLIQPTPAETGDPSFAEALSDSEVRIWINACNHEPARQALRQLLAYRVRGVTKPIEASPTPPPTDGEGDLVARLREAAEKATPGPWDVWAEPTPSKDEAVDELAYQVVSTPDEDFAEAVYLLNTNGKCPALTGCGPTSKENAEYLALANPANILEILAKVQASEAQVSTLSRQLEEAREALPGDDEWQLLLSAVENLRGGSSDEERRVESAWRIAEKLAKWASKINDFRRAKETVSHG